MNHMNNLLSHLPEVEKPAGLDGHILDAVRQAKRRVIQGRLGLAGLGALSLFGWLGFSWSAVVTELQTSSFFSFLTLVVSDPDIVLDSASQFTLGLLESLPVTALITLALSLLVLLSVLAILDGMRRGKRGVPSLHILTS